MALKDPGGNRVEGNKAGVLIVEDSEEMLWVIANVLEKAGFFVDAVITGREALEKLKEFPETKLVILNYVLPDMSGLTVLEQLRANGCKSEVIGISALRDIRDKFMEAGAFAFLEKPFDTRELVHLCKQALNRKNAVSGIPS